MSSTKLFTPEMQEKKMRKGDSLVQWKGSSCIPIHQALSQMLAKVSTMQLFFYHSDSKNK